MVVPSMASKKYGLLTDMHFGMKKSSKIILDWQMKAFYKAHKIFRENGVTDIVILGDFFDNRNTNTTFIMHTILEDVLAPLRRDFDNVYILIGNHDMYYRNKRECNILSTLISERYQNVHIVEDITRIGNILLVPWLCSEKDIAKLHKESENGGVVLGHLEINGFRMTANGKSCDHGINKSLFKNFDLVLSGHFHLKDKIGNIEYLGTMMPLSWAEYHGQRGVHILEKKKLDFFPLNLSMYDVLKFEDRVYSTDELEKYRNKIVKVLVKGHVDEDRFDDMIFKLSDISYSHTKQYIDSNDEGDDLQLEEDETIGTIKTDEELFLEYISKMLPKHLCPETFEDLYKRIRNRAEKELEIAQ